MSQGTPDYRNVLSSPSLLGLNQSLSVAQFQDRLKYITSQASDESAPSLWWLYLAAHQCYVRQHVPVGSPFSTRERLPGLHLERLSTQQFPDAWQYLVSVAEKAWDFLRTKAS